MKKNNEPIKLLLLMVPMLLLFMGCKTQVKDFIPGTYVSEWTTEFTQARDTILIEPVIKDGSAVYQVTRRTYMLFQKRPQYKLVHWTGIFNTNNQTFTITNNGRILLFDPAAHEMKMGQTSYKKL